jgi:hypothetical protein
MARNEGTEGPGKGGGGRGSDGGGSTSGSGGGGAGINTKFGKLRDSAGNLVTSERADIGRAQASRDSAAAGFEGLTSPLREGTFTQSAIPSFSFSRTRASFSPSFGIDPSGTRAGELGGLGKAARKSLGFFESVREDPAEAALEALGFAVGFVNPVAGALISLAATPAEQALDEGTGLAGFATSFRTASLQNISSLASSLTGSRVAGIFGAFAQPVVSKALGFDVESAEKALVGGVLGAIAPRAIEGIASRISNPLGAAVVGGVAAIGADVAIGRAAEATVAQRGATTAPAVSGTRTPSVTLQALGTSPFRLSPTPSFRVPSAPVRFRGVQEEQDPSTFTGATSRGAREAIEGSLAGPQISRVDVFDQNFKQINPFGFGTGRTLASTEDPTEQFSTRQRTTGGEFQQDSVSFLSRRFV